MIFFIKSRGLILFVNQRGCQDLKKIICSFQDRRPGQVEQPMFLHMVEIELVQLLLKIEQAQVLEAECPQEQFQANLEVDQLEALKEELTSM